MTENDKATAELLRCAADHMERVGLTKGTYYKGLKFDPEEDIPSAEVLILGHADYKDSPCCAFGALFACADSVDSVDSAAWEVVNYGDDHGYDIFSLHEWNDTNHRRKGDVVKLFRKTAQELDPQ